MNSNQAENLENKQSVKLETSTEYNKYNTFFNDISIPQITEELRQSWTGNGAHNLKASLSKSMKIEDNEKPMAAFADNNGVEIGFSLYNSEQDDFQFRTSTSIGHTSFNNFGFNTQFDINASNNDPLANSFIFSNSIGKRKPDSEVVAFQEKAMDTQSSTNKRMDLNMSINLNDPFSNYNINDIPESIDRSLQEAPQQPSHQLPVFPSSYISKTTKDNTFPLTSVVNMNMIPEHPADDLPPLPFYTGVSIQDSIHASVSAPSTQQPSSQPLQFKESLMLPLSNSHTNQESINNTLRDSLPIPIPSKINQSQQQQVSSIAFTEYSHPINSNLSQPQQPLNIALPQSQSQQSQPLNIALPQSQSQQQSNISYPQHTSYSYPSYSAYPPQQPQQYPYTQQHTQSFPVYPSQPQQSPPPSIPSSLSSNLQQTIPAFPPQPNFISYQEHIPPKPVYLQSNPSSFYQDSYSIPSVNNSITSQQSFNHAIGFSNNSAFSLPSFPGDEQAIAKQYITPNQQPISSPSGINQQSLRSIGSASHQSYYSPSPTSAGSVSPDGRMSVSSMGSSRSRNIMEGKKKKHYIAELPSGVRIESTVVEMKSPKKIKKWTPEEDALLLEGVRIEGIPNWAEIAKHVPGRNNTQCCQRYNKVLKPGIKKGSWSKEEDTLLLQAVESLGENNWEEVAQRVRGRHAQKCKERYTHYIGPHCKKGNWTPEEDAMILELQRQWGNSWAAIAQQLPGRPANDVRTRFKTLSNKRRQKTVVYQ